MAKTSCLPNTETIVGAAYEEQVDRNGPLGLREDVTNMLMKNYHERSHVGGHRRTLAPGCSRFRCALRVMIHISYNSLDLEEPLQPPHLEDTLSYEDA